MSVATKADVDRFIAMAMSYESESCLIWPFALTSDGYGRCVRDGFTLAHRYVYKEKNGLVGDEMHVLHSCDTPACVNPGHLREGTRVDNMQDMSVRGRSALQNWRTIDNRGSKHGMAVLTEAKVVAIRKERASGSKLSELVERHGVSKKAIQDVIHRRSWVHVE